MLLLEMRVEYYVYFVLDDLYFEFIYDMSVFSMFASISVLLIQTWMSLKISFNWEMYNCDLLWNYDILKSWILNYEIMIY